jgi:hypothetical protein
LSIPPPHFINNIYRDRKAFPDDVDMVYKERMHG